MQLICLGIATTMVGQDYSSIDQNAQSIAINRDYKVATALLIAPYEDDRSKVRAIFSWIAHHIDYDDRVLDKFRKTGKRGKTTVSYSTEEELEDKIRAENLNRVRKTLKTKKGVCQDYSLVFQFMCEEAGLECNYVRGFGRFSPDNIGRQHRKGNHAWNTVKIDGEWALVDVTWSTGMGSGEDYGDGYFDVDPGLFIFSHYPNEEKWQLLEKPIDVRTFSNLPFTYAGFLKYNITAFNPHSGYVKKNGKVTIEVDIPDEERLVLIRGSRPVNISPTKTDRSYTFDLSQKMMAGKVTISVSNKGYLEPLITMRVR